MRLNVETHSESGRELPHGFRLRDRRVAVCDIVDQWFGPDYRYCKIKGDDGAVYILRVVEHCSDWHLTLYASERLQATATLSGT
jgi:hypothetical protein